MTDDDLKLLLLGATRAASTAADVAAKATDEAAAVRHRQRSLARAVVALGAVLFVLVLLVGAVLAYIVPTAARNATILREIERVTGPEGQRASGARTAIAICSLQNENARLHGHPEGAPGCSADEMAALAEAAGLP